MCVTKTYDTAILSEEKKRPSSTQASSGSIWLRGYSHFEADIIQGCEKKNHFAVLQGKRSLCFTSSSTCHTALRTSVRHSDRLHDLAATSIQVFFARDDAAEKNFNYRQSQRRAKENYIYISHIASLTGHGNKRN